MKTRDMIKGLNEELTRIDGQLDVLHEKRDKVVIGLRALDRQPKPYKQGKAPEKPRKPRAPQNNYPKHTRELVLDVFKEAPETASFDTEEVKRTIDLKYGIDIPLGTVSSRLHYLKEENAVDFIVVGKKHCYSLGDGQ